MNSAAAYAWAKVALMVTLCILCISLAWNTRHVGRTVDDVDAALVGVNKTTDHTAKLMDTLAAGFNTSFATINRPHNGTLAEVDKTLLALKGTLTHTDLVIAHEQRQLATIDKQELVLFNDFHRMAQDGDRAAQASTKTLEAATATISASKPLVEHLDAATVSANESVAKFNALLDNPAIPATMSNVASIAVHTDKMFAIAEQVESKATKSYLHPSTNPFVRGWNSTAPYILPILRITSAVVP